MREPEVSYSELSKQFEEFTEILNEFTRVENGRRVNAKNKAKARAKNRMARASRRKNR